MEPKQGILNRDAEPFQSIMFQVHLDYMLPTKLMLIYKCAIKVSD